MKYVFLSSSSSILSHSPLPPPCNLSFSFLDYLLRHRKVPHFFPFVKRISVFPLLGRQRLAFLSTCLEQCLFSFFSGFSVGRKTLLLMTRASRTSTGSFPNRAGPPSSAVHILFFSLFPIDAILCSESYSLFPFARIQRRNCFPFVPLAHRTKEKRNT